MPFSPLALRLRGVSRNVQCVAAAATLSLTTVLYGVGSWMRPTLPWPSDIDGQQGSTIEMQQQHQLLLDLRREIFSNLSTLQASLQRQQQAWMARQDQFVQLTLWYAQRTQSRQQTDFYWTMRRQQQKQQQKEQKEQQNQRLKRSPNGCHGLKTEAACIEGKDGRSGPYLDSPCQWCCGEACTFPGNHGCEPQEYLLLVATYTGRGKNGLGHDSCQLPRRPEVPDPLASNGGAVPQAFNRQNLISTAQGLLEHFSQCCLDVHRRDDSVLRLEALALLSSFKLARLDVVIESGTASGHSAELFARFLAGSPTRIYTIDNDIEGRNETASSAARLSAFKQVTPIFGDSFMEIPALLRRHAGQRIGLFIDGPKEEMGADLCYSAIQASPDVQLCAQHDILMTEQIMHIAHTWGRTVLMTHQRYWRELFSEMDDCNVGNNCGWGAAIYAGTKLIPLGVHGDQGRNVAPGFIISG